MIGAMKNRPTTRKELVDHRDGSSFRLPVAGSRALHAFHHPYVYAFANEAASDMASAKSARVTS